MSSCRATNGKLHPASTTLSAAHLGEVKAIAAARHVPPAAIIREAVEAWLAGRPGPTNVQTPEQICADGMMNPQQAAE